MASATRPFRFHFVKSSGELSAVVGVGAAKTALEPHLHQDLEADAEKPVRQRVAADNFREVFAAHGRGLFRVGHGDEQPHADLVCGQAGLEIDSRTRNAEGAPDIFERFTFRVRGPDSHQLSKFATPAAASFRLLGARDGAAAWIVDLRHLVVLGRHGSLPFASRSEFPW